MQSLCRSRKMFWKINIIHSIPKCTICTCMKIVDLASQNLFFLIFYQKFLVDWDLTGSENSCPLVCTILFSSGKMNSTKFGEDWRPHLQTSLPIQYWILQIFRILNIILPVYKYPCSLHEARSYYAEALDAFEFGSRWWTMELSVRKVISTRNVTS